MAYSKRPAPGQATMANSEPVVIASDQSAIPVSATNLDIRDLTFAADKVDASGTVLGAGNNNIGDVDIASIAAGDNNIGNVDVVTLPSIPAGNNNIGDVDVASLPALATGDNTIGRVKLTDGTDVADILDLSNSNPLVVAIVDGSGDQITSFGGGTQYTEDAAAAGNPVGNALIAVRDDTRGGGITSNDGDNIALRGTNNGELYVKHFDALEVFTSVENFLNVTGTIALVDGDGSTLADVLNLTNNNPLAVAIVDGDGTQITSFGGGTEYTQGATDATITGTAMLMEGAGDTLLPVQGTVADGLLVNLGSNNDVTVTGSVTTDLADVMVNDGAADTGRLIQVGGHDGTNAQTLSTNSSGHLNIADGSNSITVDAPVGTPVFTTPTPSTTGGWSVFNATRGDGSTALTNSAQSVKGAQGTLGGWYIYNPNSVECYVQIYNTASGSVTVGTTNPVMMLTIPALSAANLELTNGIQFGTAISVAAVMTTAGGNTAPTTALDANFFFK